MAETGPARTGVTTFAAEPVSSRGPDNRQQNSSHPRVRVRERAVVERCVVDFVDDALLTNNPEERKRI
jgi:hypothetical protein